ncbi:allantoicase-like isoform X2 [Mizuhopecten yessoensis]|uniref:allantoicase-like isoform X2 n=1 Tax=Mizuhopecten yessoensis TaxID=6573 RepID=UPI000B45F144|nr:allantoicase-like isoform X2 [Mizuhopecten yessoensis]
MRVDSILKVDMAHEPKRYEKIVPKFTELNDLAVEKVGGKISFATDDYFGVADNLIKSTDPLFKEGLFTEFGKWMDGWETRRKRVAGHDWCIIQLGVAGCIYGVDVDTSYFTGNYTPQISIQGANLDRDLPDRLSDMGTEATVQEITEITKLHSEDWEEVLSKTPLRPGYLTSCHNYFEIHNKSRHTHLRVNMFPDGGIARLRVYGRAKRDWSTVPLNELTDLVAMENGGLCIGYSDSHFGHARHLIQPGRAENMADGWETKRHPQRPAILTADAQGILHVPGDDWCIFRLGHPGTVTKIEIDTNHFKGNFPDSCRIEGCWVGVEHEDGLIKRYDTHTWKPLLPVQKLSAHKQFIYDDDELFSCGVISHVRLCIAPDGGISRMRLWGYITEIPMSKL